MQSMHAALQHAERTDIRYLPTCEEEQKTEEFEQPAPGETYAHDVACSRGPCSERKPAQASSVMTTCVRCNKETAEGRRGCAERFALCGVCDAHLLCSACGRGWPDKDFKRNDLQPHGTIRCCECRERYRHRQEEKNQQTKNVVG